LEECHRDIEQHFNLIRSAGALPLAVGGDHSITAPILRALGRGKPVGLVHIDAHADTMGVYEGSKFHHGGPFRTAVLDGVLDPTRTIQIGMRGTADFLWEFSYESGMTVVPADEIDRRGIDWVIRRALEVVGEQPTYVSFDVDALDPVFAPGTGTPEVGGLTTREALAILRGLNGINMIGGDVVEVAPMYDPTTNTAHAGAQILFQLLCLAATSHTRRRKALPESM
jgi:agmatinase